MTDWFRSWHGAPTDPKWVLIARKAGCTPAVASAIAWALFDHASQASPRGSVERFDAEVYAAWGGLDEDVVKNALEVMTERGMIVGGHLSAWSKRQPEREDGSAERAKAWRDRKKDEANAERTHANARERNRPTDKRREDTDITEAKASDAPKAPQKPVYTDAKHELWGEGKGLLADLGVPASKSSPLIGQWLRETGDDAAGVLDAIRRARDAKPHDPIPWIVRALKKPTPFRRTNTRMDAIMESQRDADAGNIVHIPGV